MPATSTYAAIGQPFLDRLASELGEGIKLSVIDREGILVLAAAQGRREYALTVAPGQRLPSHAGAASKLLLAYLPPDELDYWLAKPLAAYTAKTITDPKRLRTELGRIGGSDGRATRARMRRASRLLPHRSSPAAASWRRPSACRSWQGQRRAAWKRSAWRPSPRHAP